MRNLKKSVIKGKNLRSQLAKFKAEFSKDDTSFNTSNSGIGFGQLRKELEGELLKRLGQSPNFMRQSAGAGTRVITLPCGFKYIPLFKSKKRA